MSALKIPLANGVSYLSTEYGYDNADRVLSMLHTAGAATIENLTYGYDANGNRTGFSRNAAQALSLPISGTSYDQANRMLTYNGKTLRYDVNGNLESKTDVSGTTTYGWDARNRLVAINGPSVTAAFAYDAVNRRIRKTVNGTTTQYVYDGWDIIQELTSGMKVDYVRLPTIDEPLTRVDGATVLHYLADVLGSTVALIDDAGTAKTTYIYDAYGGATPTGERSENSFLFTGRENDGTGLYHYRFRYYSPEMQRFISEDPIRFEGGFNFYSMTGSNPINFTDPLGLYFGQYPPSPPGYNPSTWQTSQWDNGLWNLRSPDGRIYTIHPEDNQHWRHLGIQDGNGRDKGDWPPNPGKPRPGQNKLKCNQSDTDPSGNAPEWTPPFMPFILTDPLPFRVPRLVPFRIPVFAWKGDNYENIQ